MREPSGEIPVGLPAETARKRKSAFTLVELIVVITILAILATVGFLTLSGYTDDARSATVAANVRTVYSAILTESTTSGNSPRYYVDHDPAAALSGGIVFVDGGAVALTGGQWGSGGTNYSAGNPKWDRLRMNGDKFRISAAFRQLPGAFGFGGAGLATEAGAAYDTGAISVGAFDYVGKAGLSGRARTAAYFQVAGVSPGTKKASVTGNYTAIGTGAVLGLVKDPAQSSMTWALSEGAAIGTVATYPYFSGNGTSGDPYRAFSEAASATTVAARSCQDYNANATSLNGGALRGSGSCDNSKACLSDGIYLIDPDGNGGNAAFQVNCDMTANGGGWTEVENAKTATTPSNLYAGIVSSRVSGNSVRFNGAYGVGICAFRVANQTLNYQFQNINWNLVSGAPTTALTVVSDPSSYSRGTCVWKWSDFGASSAADGAEDTCMMLSADKNSYDSEADYYYGYGAIETAPGIEYTNIALWVK